MPTDRDDLDRAERLGHAWGMLEQTLEATNDTAAQRDRKREDGGVTIVLTQGQVARIREWLATQEQRDAEASKRYAAMFGRAVES